MKNNIEIVSKSLRHASKGLTLNGILIIICGILIFVYPELLGMLVGTFLIAIGIISIIVAKNIWKFSKIEVEEIEKD